MKSQSTQDGLSYKVKIPIIILTIITMVAMGAFFIKIIYSIDSSEKLSNNYQYLLNIGDKLKNQNLYEQAIDQYIKYLEKTKLENPSHAFVSHDIGKLYIELSNCQEGIVWLFQAEEAKASYSRADELKTHIDACLTKINSSKPINLNSK
jgi:tetratricopeptide (TPR) repeat protein